jgi:hypothetical protein
MLRVHEPNEQKNRRRRCRRSGRRTRARLHGSGSVRPAAETTCHHEVSQPTSGGEALSRAVSRSPTRVEKRAVVSLLVVRALRVLCCLPSSCLPCHSTHAARDPANPAGLWVVHEQRIPSHCWRATHARFTRSTCCLARRDAHWLEEKESDPTILLRCLCGPRTSIALPRRFQQVLSAFECIHPREES